MISIIPGTLSILSCHFYTSIKPLKSLTPLVMELLPSSMLLGKGAVDGLGGTVKRSVWKFVKAGGNIPADAMHYIQELLVNAIQT